MRFWILMIVGMMGGFARGEGVSPALERPAGLACDIDGDVGQRVKGVVDRWLLRAPEDNPAMLGMFRDREKTPYRDLLPWSGEFAGKYLCAACEVYRLTGRADLRRRIETFVGALQKCQDPDGY